MIALLLDKQKKKTPKSLRPDASFSIGKAKKGENSTSEHSDGNENNFGYKNPESSSEETENSEAGAEDNHFKRMSEIEKCLEAITHRGNLQEVGVVRSYPAEWDVVPYPPKFKTQTLQTFDGKGSPNQHIYYFKFQTVNVVSNDTILARLFIDTLKRVAFK